MKTTTLLVAAVVVIGLAGCTSTDCGVQTYQSPCAAPVVVQAPPPCAAPMAAKDTDFLGNECGKPVYEGPHCIEMPQAVRDWFAAMHENIFNCQPDPVMLYQVPACPPPAAPKAANPCNPCDPCR